MVLPVICSECGNDVATQGHGLCMDCLEELTEAEHATLCGPSADPASHDPHQ